jgi:hypothetical protein
MKMPAPSDSEIRSHTILESIVYHLAPGVLIAAVYYLIAPAVRAAGYPSVMALTLVAAAVLVPVELGILLRQGRRQTGRWSIRSSMEALIPYRSGLNWRQYLLWVPVIFVASGLIMTVMNPVGAALEGWFGFIPESYRLDLGLSGEFARGKLIQTYLLHFVVLVVTAPAVEELYFRGFLLPRMPANLGRAAPVLHSLFFALYHLWSPWMIASRTAALLPLIYIVRWKRNVYLGMGAHWLINSLDFIAAVVFIAGIG